MSALHIVQNGYSFFSVLFVHLEDTPPIWISLEIICVDDDGMMINLSAT